MLYKIDTPSYITASTKSYALIKSTQNDLKRNMTKAEVVLWKEVRRGKLGYKFRRQQIIDRFIVDFVCLSKRLVVEVDGAVHKGQVEYDYARTERLQGLGYKVCRFTNKEVIDNIEKVIRMIQEKLKSSYVERILSVPLSGTERGEVCFEG